MDKKPAEPMVPQVFHEEDLSFLIECSKCKQPRILNKPCPRCGHWNKYFEEGWVEGLQQAELARALDNPAHLLGELRHVLEDVLQVPQDLQVFRWMALLIALLKHTSLPLEDLRYLEDVEKLVKKHRAPFFNIEAVRNKEPGA
jgi:hypothetical protein